MTAVTVVALLVAFGSLVAAALLVGVVIGWTAHRDRFPATEETDEPPPTWWAPRRSTR